MGSVTWNRFPTVSKIADVFKPAAFVETSFLNTDMCKFESSQEKKADSDPCRLIPRKLTANLETFTCQNHAYGFYVERSFIIAKFARIAT